jgi:hypothetical protein
MSETNPAYGKNMIAISGIYKDFPTLCLSPATIDCPYMEAFVDREVGWLVVITKIEKESLNMIPRLNEDGDPIPNKKPRRSGKNYQEQRISIRTFEEFYIRNPKEIEAFIKAYAVNLKGFEYKNLITRVQPEPASPIIKPENVILDENSQPMVAEKK